MTNIMDPESSAGSIPQIGSGSRKKIDAEKQVTRCINVDLPKTSSSLGMFGLILQ